MTQETKNDLQLVINNGGFAAQVAQTVLNTCNCSYKQYEILEGAGIVFFDFNELNTPDTFELKHDVAFEAMQERQVRNQSAGL